MLTLQHHSPHHHYDMSTNNEETESTTSSHSHHYRKNTFSWSSTSSSNSTFISSTTTIDEEHEEEEDNSFPIITSFLTTLRMDFSHLSTLEKQKRISEILGRAASHGDLNTIQQIMMDTTLSPYCNLDAPDDLEDGSTPLIYASCFGKLDVVRYLLQQGAKVDIQDKIGWTALMWATTNGHSQIVELLLEYSASSETKSVSGRTIYDLVDVKNEKMISILSMPLLSPIIYSSWRRASLISNKSSLLYNEEQEMGTPAPTTTIEREEISFRSVHNTRFIWDQCLPDQMFVFAESEIDHILNVAISELKLPVKSRIEIYVPTNIIFLCARYAHYYTSRDLLSTLLSRAVKRIESVVKTNSNDIHIMTLWIANLSQLLYYLKKDVGLVVATAEYQLEISELISETYGLLVVDSEKRMDRILEPAMIEFEQLNFDQVNFVDDWHRFFRSSRSSNNSRYSISSSTNNSNNRKSIPLEQQSLLTPQSITSLLTSILYVLQSYDVHPVIVIQAMAQLFHFLSCEIFNRILLNKKYLCRSKALQIRMNITIIEEWVRKHGLPNTLNSYFNPVIQLMQLLQCVSQLQDLIDFISTMKSFDLLNSMQVKRLVLNYRYEVNEQKLPEEIEKYTMQLAEDTLKSMSSGGLVVEEEVSARNSSNSRPNSISSLGSLLQSIQHQKPQQQQGSTSRVSLQSVESTTNKDDIVLIGERRDSKYMLPFSLPTTTNMIHYSPSTPINKPVTENMSLSDTIYFELKNKLSAKREINARERSLVPSIPEEWLDKLDHHSSLE